MAMARRAALLAAAASALACAGGAALPPAKYHRYLLVGAGPGGLQMAHYLDTAERDYLVLEKVRRGFSFSPSMWDTARIHAPRQHAAVRRDTL